MGYSIEIVESNEKVCENIYELKLKSSEEIKPGQFFMLKTEESRVLLPRPISVCDVNNNEVTFLYQVVGQGTKELSRLKNGDTLSVMGPLGNGFPIDEVKGKIALVAGGIGSAPMVYLSKILNKDKAKRGIEKIHIYGGYKDHSYYGKNLSKNVDEIFISTESGKEGKKGFVTDIFNPKEYDAVFCCGPEIMMEKVTKICKENNVPIYVSLETKMACGIGACLVCTCKTKEGKNKRTCKDGPVFRGEEIEFNA